MVNSNCGMRAIHFGKAAHNNTLLLELAVSESGMCCYQPFVAIVLGSLYLLQTYTTYGLMSKCENETGVIMKMEMAGLPERHTHQNVR